MQSDLETLLQFVLYDCQTMHHLSMEIHAHQCDQDVVEQIHTCKTLLRQCSRTAGKFSVTLALTNRRSLERVDAQKISPAARFAVSYPS